MSEGASLADRLDRWMFSAFELSPRGAAIYRMLFAAGVLLAIKPPVWGYIADYPDSFFSPPFGVTFFFFTGFPPPLYFQALNVVLVFAAVALVFGWHTRVASFALAASIFAGNAWSYSFGKINHDILFIVVPLVMGFSGWGDALSVDATRRKGPPQHQCLAARAARAARRVRDVHRGVGEAQERLARSDQPRHAGPADLQLLPAEPYGWAQLARARRQGASGSGSSSTRAPFCSSAPCCPRC